MNDELELRCDRGECGRALTEETFRLAYRTGDTERRVYECDCGALTITIGRLPESV